MIRRDRPRKVLEALLVTQLGTRREERDLFVHQSIKEKQIITLFAWKERERTWGILKSRRRLATWMDVTEEEAPTTPEMTLVVLTPGTAPS